MMQCPKCYTPISTAAAYCPRCGAPLSSCPPKRTSSAMPSGGGFMSAPSDLNARSSHAPHVSAPRSAASPAPQPVRAPAPSYASFTEKDDTLKDGFAPVYTEPVPPRMSSPNPVTPVRMPAYAGADRLPDRRNACPLSVTGVMITALIGTILMLLRLKSIFDPPELFSNFFAILDLVDEDISDTANYLLYNMLPLGELEDMMNIVQLITELPNIIAVIVMWCIFGAISGRELNRSLFCGSISFIKFFHIISLSLAVLSTILVAVSPILLEVSAWPDYLGELFATLYFVCLLSMIFITAYRSAIVRLLTALQDGARSGHYQGASGFLIFCLFVTGIVNGIASLCRGVSDMDAVIELLNIALLPLIHAICLCTYNSRRHSINLS